MWGSLTVSSNSDDITPPNPMKRYTLDFHDELAKALVAEAKRCRRPIVEVVRIALENHLAKTQPITR